MSIAAIAPPGWSYPGSLALNAVLTNAANGLRSVRIPTSPGLPIRNGGRVGFPKGRNDQDGRYLEVAAEFGPALDRLARGYEADADLRRDLRQEIHTELWRCLAQYVALAQSRGPLLLRVSPTLIVIACAALVRLAGRGRTRRVRALIAELEGLTGR